MSQTRMAEEREAVLIKNLDSRRQMIEDQIFSYRGKTLSLERLLKEYLKSLTADEHHFQLTPTGRQYLYEAQVYTQTLADRVDKAIALDKLNKDMEKAYAALKRAEMMFNKRQKNEARKYFDKCHSIATFLDGPYSDFPEVLDFAEDFDRVGNLVSGRTFNREQAGATLVDTAPDTYKRTQVFKAKKFDRTKGADIEVRQNKAAKALAEKNKAKAQSLESTGREGSLARRSTGAPGARKTPSSSSGVKSSPAKTPSKTNTAKTTPAKKTPAKSTPAKKTPVKSASKPVAKKNSAARSDSDTASDTDSDSDRPSLGRRSRRSRGSSSGSRGSRRSAALTRSNSRSRSRSGSASGSGSASERSRSGSASGYDSQSRS